MDKGAFGFLLVGAGRGGTSLLAGILDAHSHLEVAYEAFTTSHLMGQGLCGALKDNYFFRVGAFLHECEQQARQHPERYWGNKITTEHLKALSRHNAVADQAPVEIVEEFFQCSLGGQKIIFILRDGRSCIDSKVRRTGQDIQVACNRWRFSVAVLRWLRESGREFLLVRFEDLLADAPSEVRRVCDYLGVPFEDGMIRDGAASQKILPEYRQAGVARERPLPELPAEVLAQIADDLRYCGYTV